MSSTASHRAALLIAFGGVSIAALFLWYTARKEGDRKRLKRELSNSKVPNGDEVVNTENHNEVRPTEVGSVTVEEGDSTVLKVMTSACIPESSEQENEPPSKNEETRTRNETHATTSTIVDDQKSVLTQDTAEVDGEVDTTIDMSAGDYVLEDKMNAENTSALMLDCSSTNVEKEAFSWSEEMERSYIEATEQGQGDQDICDFQHRDSPGVVSQHSEDSSQDSGRATGGLASSLSPMDEAPDGLPMYEFEIPNSLVGLIIGVKGKTIKELSVRTDVRMLIRQHHLPEKANTHQICQVRGKRDQINRCLQMLRRRFPPARFPELNLQPVIPPPLPNNLFDALTAQPSWLSLPENIPCEVVCSSVIDPGHFFLQQPTHPSFPSLTQLDMYMLRLYTQGNSIPELPRPTQSGLLCAAPVLGAWFRAVTVRYLEENDEVLVRFVDYGGYTKIPRCDLRQIRTDLMSLPFQATECYLAHVQPIDGTWQWGEAATSYFHKLCMGKVINASVVGMHVDDKVPMVELTAEDEHGKVLRLDRALMNAGFAKASDPSKMVRSLDAGQISSTKRVSLASQSSQVLASV